MRNTDRCLLSLLLSALPEMLESHRPDSKAYKLLNSLAWRCIEELPLLDPRPVRFQIHPFGELVFPYFNMGAIDSTHLFGLDELIIFAFYISNVGRYKRVADLGANIGLHSIVLSKLGYSVSSFEPDPIHYKRLRENLQANVVEQSVQPEQAAVAAVSGSAEFVRVIGNTTSSHLSGAKSEPYGELQYFSVQTRAFSDIMRCHDLIKMDIEGYEATALLSTTGDDWQNCDIILEIGSYDNAQLIWELIQDYSLACFVQRKGWNKALGLKELPVSYKGGSVFITKKAQMHW